MRRHLTIMTLGAAGACVAQPAAAQVGLDRADPTITEQALPKPVPVRPADSTVVTATPSRPVLTPDAGKALVANMIVIDGNRAVPTEKFAPALIPFIGRELRQESLVKLAGAVADVARQAGYPFASASIAPQNMAGNVLHVTLDEGRIAAVRVIGAINPLADQILTRALVGDAPVRRETLERAILLVGDIPGLSVRGSRYVNQDGFGILLVTVAEDRASAYAQIENRGSAEVGPIRATALASYRGLGVVGDELALVGASTVLEPTEFAFLRARYSAPIGFDGGVVRVSGSYGRARPGGLLQRLDVIGNSTDASVGYAYPLLRSRAESVWGGVELRGVRSDQTLLGARLRRDRLVTLTGSLNGTASAGPGALRAELAVVAGLPVAGVTHQADPAKSRADGDARFATFAYAVDWTAPIADRVSVVFASSGQLASRPLLATAEIGLGGPSFGRAYDYAERTGDEGVLGSAELRTDLGRVSALIDRMQLYGFVDGGYVDNLRDGVGGGSLLSSGGGARLGSGRLDGMVEIAFPMNADRFDTGTKRPRVSFRLARRF